MPELPEVETIRRHLAPHVEGRTLERAGDPRRALVPAARAGRAAPPRSQGRRVERLGRRGKYLVWELSDDVVPAHAPAHDRHAAARPGRRRRRTRACGSTSATTSSSFDDPRRFGTGELALGPEALDAFFAARLGVEPLERDFTGEHLYALARTSRAPIKAFLLDQKRVAGVGNIYADEALFRARIHPLRPANRLTRAQCAALRDARRRVARGRDRGQGRHDRRLPRPLRRQRDASRTSSSIHLREGEPCPNCGSPVRKLRAAGRGTYVCERCQPRPRARARRPRPRGEPRGARRGRPRRAPGSRRSARRR